VTLPLSGSGFPAALTFALLAEESGHGGTFLGLPIWIWQIVNLVGFFAVLIYFVARPMAEAFRKRQVEVEQRARAAETHRADVQRLAGEIRERTARIEREIEEIRRQGQADGGETRKALAARADEESDRIRKDTAEEIDRRVAAARGELKLAAADLTAAAAADLLSREITADDRERLLADSVDRLREGAR
jgi:F0F1-type ATP synthase membrane subunit b/b'